MTFDTAGKYDSLTALEEKFHDGSMDCNERNKYKELKFKIVEDQLKEDDLVTMSVLGASRYGFVKNSIRQKCWTRLLMAQLDINPTRNEMVENLSHVHPDENQVELDVNRTFGHIYDVNLREQMKELLREAIITVLRRHSTSLRYYQGYHDIVSVFVVVFANIEPGKHHYGKQLIAPTIKKDLINAVDTFTLLYLRDYMMDSLDFAIDQLRIISYILNKHDKPFAEKLKLDDHNLFFAISSVLTLFSHQFKPVTSLQENSTTIIFEIFDAIISCQSMIIPIIMYSKFIMMNKRKLLREYEENLSVFDNENDLIHVIIQKVLINETSVSESKGEYNNENINSIWYDILQSTRDDFISNKVWIPRLTKIINKYSPLLTTAGNICPDNIDRKNNSANTRKHKYSMIDVNNMLQQQIGINKLRKELPRDNTHHDIIRFYRSQDKNVLLRLIYSVYDSNMQDPQGKTTLLKVSILMGIFAVIIHLYQRQPRSLRSLFLGQYPVLYSSGLQLRQFWQNPVRTAASLKRMVLGDHDHDPEH